VNETYAGFVVGAATVVTGTAVLLATAVLVATRSVRVALPVLLDLLLAAGLLRLAIVDTWNAIAVAAAVVVIRKLAVAGLTAGSRSR